ncbi:hypothetical protein [Sphingopyxis sp. MSC1_008]|uniref:hypothetical protein n=1 Tax=Sphingopyxis sp. MSC1_008 TaxID=2909265 RepID=UPI0020BFDB92|nr:hypothetical protein [Sphingopyxis sp. MSC1_008]
MVLAQDAPTLATNGDYYIITAAERRVVELPDGPLYWKIERYPSAEAAKDACSGDYALTATIAGRHWLFTLGPKGAAGHGGKVITEIGPVVVPLARSFLLRVNRAGGPPGSQTPVHNHPGSESIYVLRGQISQRTPHGVIVGNAGDILNAHAPEMAMQITSTGAVDLEQIVLFVVDADRPFSPPASFDATTPVR